MTRVLVIDDEADLRFLIREVLSLAGVEVTEASSGAEGLELLAAAEKPDVVILDVQMPEMDGWETLATLRSRGPSPGVAVIMCTVKSHPGDAVRAWETGCDGLLGKPFAVDELVSTIVGVAERSEPERVAHRELELVAARRALAGGDLP